MSSQTTESLASKSVRGIGWRSFSLTSNIVLHLLAVTVTARFLGPAEIGDYAYILIFMDPLLLLAQLGVPSAVVQRKTIDQGLVRRLSLVGVAVGLTVWLLSSACALLLLDRRIALLFSAAAASIPVASVSFVSEGLILRDLQLDCHSKAEFASQLGYAVSAIVLVVLGAGVWSLVVATLVQSGLRSAGLLYYKPIPLKAAASSRQLGEVLRYGAWTMSSRLVFSIGRNTDSWLVERLFGGAALGLYNRALRVARLPSEMITNTLGSVVFPGFSRLQGEPERLKRAYLFATQVFAYASLPIAGFFMLYAEETVQLLLGPRWGAAVEPLRALMIVGGLSSLAKVDDDLLRGCGRVVVHNVLFIAYTAVVVIACWICSRWGLFGIGLGVSVACLLRMLALHGAAAPLIGVRWKEWLKGMVPGMLALAITALVGHALLRTAKTIGAPDWLTLLIGGCGFLVSWWAAFRFLPGAQHAEMRRFFAQHLSGKLAIKSLRSTGSLPSRPVPTN